MGLLRFLCIVRLIAEGFDDPDVFGSKERSVAILDSELALASDDARGKFGRGSNTKRPSPRLLAALSEILGGLSDIE